MFKSCSAESQSALSSSAREQGQEAVWKGEQSLGVRGFEYARILESGRSRLCGQVQENC
jgi:hypothetical protein